MHLCYNRRNILRDYSQHLISLLLYLVIRLTQGHSVSRVLREKHKLFSTFTPFLLFILYVIYDLVEIFGGSEGDNQNFKKYKVFKLVDFLAIRCFRRLMFLGKN
jgi:hypothetical protein